MLPEALLQIVICARDVPIIIAMEQPSAVAACHLQEMRQCRFKRTAVPFGYPYRTQHLDKCLFHLPTCLPVAVREDVSGCPDPPICTPDRRPGVGGRGERVADQLLHLWDQR